ncbi:formamidase [Zafaria cholistanensis]|uniref:Formamidase n=1 Tax=Zafaria cholistanensis TaxID=1682741 RepID=A0A5A7NPJ8_9MICC|nr:acetamidase/formamidase family protein [Zafaria cholistanensis]GER22609.1 formamidase [Zafaria cholistanensis]
MTTILQPGEHLPAGAPYLPSAAGNVLWGRLPCAADAPVLKLEPGTEAVIDTISHEGILEDQGRDPRAFFATHGVDGEQVLRDAVALAAGDCARDPGTDGPHVVTGPIHVAGARPGDLLKITVAGLERRVPYGVVSNRHGRGALPGEYPRGPGNVSVFAGVEDTPRGACGTMAPFAGAGRSIRFPLRPFLGTMGVAVDADTRPHSVPPGRHGGNIDINLMVEGASLYLPVQVEGALAYVGDPHFAQGDGEVALTAMEASLRARLRFDVVPREDALRLFGDQLGPVAETADYLVPTGMDEDLDLAVQDCVRAAVALLQARWGLDAEHAYAYLSAATDFNISQVVDLVKGVHARIRIEDFAEVAK